MKGYKLSLQATYPAGLDGSQKSRSSSGSKSSRNSGTKPTRSSKGVAPQAPDLQFFASKTVSSHESRNADAPVFNPNPARHSTSCCTDLSQRRELEKRFSSPGENASAAFDPAGVGHSFRSEDSESLALWEEKEQNGQSTVSGDLGRLKLGGQSPWRDSVTHAVKKIESLSHVVVGNKEKLRASWRSSPVHPKADTVDNPRLSLDRSKVGARSPWRDLMASSAARSNEAFSHDSVNLAWYSNSPKKLAIGDTGSIHTPTPTSKLSRQSASCELNSASTAAQSERADMGLCMEDQAPEELSPGREAYAMRRERKNNSQSCITAGEIRYNSSVVARDISMRPELAKEVTLRPATAAWKIPLGVSSTEPDQSTQKVSSNSECVSEIKCDNTRRLSSVIAWDTMQISPQETPMRAPGAVPFEWEDRPGKPKTIAAEAEEAPSRKFSSDSAEALPPSMEMSSSLKQSHSMDEAVFTELASEAEYGHQQISAGSMTPPEGERKASHRFYNRTSSKSRSSRMSSGDGTQAGVIDLVAPSSAKFLEHGICADSPVMAPIKSAGAVPFKWEEAPGKPKVEDLAATTQAQCNTLQLPPRLAAPHPKGPLAQESPRNQTYINKSRSAPLAGFYTHLPPRKSTAQATQSVTAELEGVAQKMPPRVRTVTGSPAKESATPPASLKDPATNMVTARIMTMESIMVKSKSVSEARSPLRTLFGPAGSPAADRIADKLCNTVYLTAHPYLQKRYFTSDIDPSSPTSILYGPDEGSQASSNPSLSYERNIPLISATPTASVSHSSSNSSSSFASIDHDSEVTSPAYGLTPSDAKTIVDTRRSSSSSGSTPKDSAGLEVGAGGASDGVKALIKLCQNGSRWVKTKAQPKLGTIHSPEVWAPTTAATYHHCADSPNSSEQLDGPDAAPADPVERSPEAVKSSGLTRTQLLYAMSSVEREQPASESASTKAAPNSSFSARLGGRYSPLRLFTRSDASRSGGNSGTQVDSRFASVASSPSLHDEELGDRSPAYTATLELLSPAQASSSKKRRMHVKPKVRLAWRSSARFRVRARFLVPVSKALKHLFSRCTVRSFTRKQMVAEPKLLHHVDRTLSAADLRFCKPT